ncbi:MAG: four helix bundle protein [Gemmatimonadaceae bacterium]
MSDFKELKVWQKAHDLALAVNRIANVSRAPAHSALRSQVIRAAMSIDANIAEGRGRQSDREQIRFLRISVGSCYELESHLIMSRDVGFVRASDAHSLLEQLVEVRKMLFGLIKYLQTAPTPRA